ncbi:MAG TPA: response regulator transcription factor [Bryobacteraceae bacterium]|nr:response regulator transcription factor [Bryobacteraceae bacterium]
MKVLVVDDDPQARRVLRTALVIQGFEVNDARSGEEALEKLRKETPDTILLDLKMPGMGGIDACRQIRELSEVPIIIVSARNSTEDRTEAFEAGADQYVSKPCGIQEIVARIRAAKRRADLVRSPALSLGEVEVNFETHEVKRPDGTMHLTAKEFKLLHFLASRAGEIVSHRRILQAVWGPDYGDEVEYLRVCINQLRKKIELDPASPVHLLTEPSVGYRLSLPRAGRSARQD